MKTPLATILIGLALCLGCSKHVSDPKDSYRVTEIKVLRGEASEIRDGNTYVFTATGSGITIRGKAFGVPAPNIGSLYCKASDSYVWLSNNGKDCEDVDPQTIAEIVDEKQTK